MAERLAQRHLAASLAADVADCSHLLNEDEAGKVAAWRSARRDAIDPAPEAHGRRVIWHNSDSFLAQFVTVERAPTAALCRMLDAVEAHPNA